MADAPQPHADLVTELVQLIRRELPSITQPLEGSTSLSADIALDSLQMMTLVVAIENHFQICLDDAPERALPDTLDELAAVVAVHRLKASSP